MARNGGIAYTQKGYQRGPTDYIIAQSFAEILHELTPRLLMAAHIRAGVISKEAGCRLLEIQMEQVTEDCMHLEKIQDELRKAHKYKHKNTNPGDKGLRTPANSWLEMNWEWLAGAEEMAKQPPTDGMMREEEEQRAAREQLVKMRSHSLKDLLEGLGTVEMHASVPDNIGDAQTLAGRGTMANIADRPSATNCDQLSRYYQAMQLLFGKTPAWQRTNHKFMESVCEWSLHLNNVEYQKLRKARDASVLRKTRAEWMWGLLKNVQKIKAPEMRNRLVLNLLGDYHRFSLNPQVRSYVPTVNVGEGAKTPRKSPAAAAGASSSAASSSSIPAASVAASAAEPPPALLKNIAIRSRSADASSRT